MLFCLISSLWPHSIEFYLWRDNGPGTSFPKTDLSLKPVRSSGWHQEISVYRGFSIFHFLCIWNEGLLFALPVLKNEGYWQGHPHIRFSITYTKLNKESSILSFSLNENHAQSWGRRQPSWGGDGISNTLGKIRGSLRTYYCSFFSLQMYLWKQELTTGFISGVFSFISTYFCYVHF